MTIGLLYIVISVVFNMLHNCHKISSIIKYSPMVVRFQAGNLIGSVVTGYQLIF